MTNPSDTTLLVVEDEFLIALGLELILQDAGYHVLEPVTTIEEALAVVATQPADLALLDVNLAGHQVYPVADALASKNVPYIFLSGCEESDLPPRFAGVRLLVKPFSADKLLNAIRQVLGDGEQVALRAT